MGTSPPEVPFARRHQLACPGQLLPLAGNVREIARSGPVVQLIHFDAKTPPACHVLTYLSDSRQFANPYPGIGRGTLQHLIIEVATLDSTHTKVKNISQHSYKM